jgi:hypothetical protein
MASLYKIIEVTTKKTNWVLTIIILIIGFGIGWLLIFLIPKKVKVITFPYSKENLEMAHDYYNDCDIKIRVIPAEQYKLINFAESI